MTRIGEVIASSTSRFTAQCPDDESVPPLGGFVVVDTTPGRALAIVSEIRSGPFDGSRRAVAYGLDQGELLAQQPQLMELLATEFEAHLVGWDDGSGWRQLLPPQPPRLHRFVHLAEEADVRSVTATGDYLRTLAAADVTDDVLAAVVRASLRARDDDQTYLVRTGQALARLFADEYERLQALLRRITA